MRRSRHPGTVLSSALRPPYPPRAGARTVAVLALALAFLAPPALAPSGGGDRDGGSTAGATLFVSLNDTTCLAALPDGSLLAGLDGGGVAEWDPSGMFIALGTAVEGLPSGHVTDLAVWHGTALAATERGLARRTGPGTWETLTALQGLKVRRIEVIEDASGAGTEALILSGSGTAYNSTDGARWSPVELPAGLPRDGWVAIDEEGALLALTNGTDLVLADLATGNCTNLTVPGGPFSHAVNDLAFDHGTIVVATDESPKVYDLQMGTWSDHWDPATDGARWGGNWSRVASEGHRTMVGSRVGTLIEYTPNSMADPFWSPWGEVTGNAIGRAIADIAVDRLNSNRSYVATPSGTWSLSKGNGPMRLGSGAVGDLPSSDVLAIECAGGIVWSLTAKGLVGLALTSSGLPMSWSVTPPSAYATTELRDSAELAGTVYLAVDRGIWTYDLYASSRPSRWNLTHVSTDLAFSQVTAVEVLNGTLYAGGPLGLDRMQPSVASAEWIPVAGSPAMVLDLAAWGDLLLVATLVGLWTYEPSSGHWDGPDAMHWLGHRPVDALAVVGDTPFAFAGDTIHWLNANGTDGSLALPTASKVQELSGLPGRAGPAWTVVNDGAMAFTPGGDATYFGHDKWGASVEGPTAMGGAIVSDAAVGPDGTAYLATDCGVFRVGQYNQSWRSWTTSENLSANDIRTLALEPATDRLWVGAYGGVDVLDTATGAIESLTTDQGLPSNLVYDVIMREGDVWVGMDAGGAVRRPLSGGSWQVYNMTTGLIEEDVQALASLGDKVMFGTDSGVTVLDTATSAITSFTSSSTAGRLPGDWVWCELGAGDIIWVGTDQGLGAYDARSGTFAPNGPVSFGQSAVRSLAEDRLGRIWVGTSAGLLVYNATSGEVELDLDHTAGLPGDEVLSLTPDSQGWMWAGTSAGVAMVDMGGRVGASFTTRDGLVNDRVTSIAEHPDGTVWFGTAGGLSRLKRSPWHIMPQLVVSHEDLPDLAVSQADVLVDPASPNEGDNVTFSVTVSNPSRVPAIATVALMSDRGGRPGDTLATSIAYTAAGGCYTVALVWNATGGEVPLWVVVDPLGMVPESDRRNNVVAFSIHVNHPPRLTEVDLTFTGMVPTDITEPELSNVTNLTGEFVLTVRYSDADGDPPVGISMSGGTGPSSDLVPIAGTGDLVSGRPYRGSLGCLNGDTPVLIRASDGRANASLSTVVHFNLHISATGIARDSNFEGRATVRVQVTGPWEGRRIDSIKAYIQNLENDSAGIGFPAIKAAPWEVFPEVHGTRAGMNLTLDSDDIPPGRYNIWIVATDDRGLASSTLVTDVTVTPPNEGTAWQPWAAVLLAGVLAMAVLGFAIRRRGPS